MLLASVTTSPVTFVVIACCAVLAPVIAELTGRLRLPGVLFEILLGILVGPSVLGWAKPGPFVQGLAQVGLALLMFMAGYELDFDRLRGAPLNRAVLTWFGSLAVALAVGFGLASTGFVISGLMVGLALTTTAIGTLLPMMRDRGVIGTPWGDLLLAGGAMGEFGPIVAITLLLSGSSPVSEALLLVAFVLVAVATAFVAAKRPPERIGRFVERHLNTSAQFPVRVLVLLLGAMLLLAWALSLDTILGAFVAGMIARLMLRGASVHTVESKMEAIGFGFLIPFFFVMSGVNFDLDQLADPATLVRVPVFLALFFVARGVPALLVYRGLVPGRARLALATLQSAALPLVVVITTIGLESKMMRPQNAAALVGAAMLSIVVFPLVGFALAPKPEPVPESSPGLAVAGAASASPEPLDEPLDDALDIGPSESL